MVVISHGSMGVVTRPLRVAKLSLPPISPLRKAAIFYWGALVLPTNKMILKLFLRERSPPSRPVRRIEGEFE